MARFIVDVCEVEGVLADRFEIWTSDEAAARLFAVKKAAREWGVPEETLDPWNIARFSG